MGFWSWSLHLPKFPLLPACYVITQILGYLQQQGAHYQAGMGLIPAFLLTAV